MKRNNILQKACFLVLPLLFFATPAVNAAPMKARVIQQYFAQDREGLDKSFEWTLNELRKCDPSLDIIVLPEFSEVPGKTKSNQDFLQTARTYGPILLQLCAETARRCNSLVFAGVVDTTIENPRNAIFIFNRNGEVIGKYYKEHLTRGEWSKLDKSYTEQWTKPYILDIEGVRYAFLTCYDFYFYENFANIARWKPDIIIGCSHQRSDTFRALDIINTFCAYNTGAYLVRASVSMGVDSPLGGCSSIVAPTGEILGALRSEIATLDATFDPKEKYLKPAGYGNPPSLHSEYIEIGRRPWKYRPGGSAIVPPLPEAPSKRLCALKGLSSVISNNLLASLGAAVAIGASEVEFDLEETEDEKGILLLEEVLKKLSCHTIMNIHLKAIEDQPWKEENLQKVIDLIKVFDAQNHVYFMSGSSAVQEQLLRIAPEVPRCMGYVKGRDIVEDALKFKCCMIQLSKSDFDQSIIDRAKEKGLRCNLFEVDDPKEAEAFFAKGIDTILTKDYQSVSEGTGVK